jgi:hypothetical protein
VSRKNARNGYALQPCALTMLDRLSHGRSCEREHVEQLPPSVQVIWDEAVTVGSEQIAASVTVNFAIS